MIGKEIRGITRQQAVAAAPNQSNQPKNANQPVRENPLLLKKAFIPTQPVRGIPLLLTKVFIHIELTSGFKDYHIHRGTGRSLKKEENTRIDTSDRKPILTEMHYRRI